MTSIKISRTKNEMNDVEFPGIQLRETLNFLLNLRDPQAQRIFELGNKIDKLNGRFFWSKKNRSHKRRGKFLYKGAK